MRAEVEPDGTSPMTCQGCGSPINADDPDAYADPGDIPACSWSCRQEAFERARGGA